MLFFLKALISGLVIAGVSELGKRYSVVAALLASLPLTSILAMLWLYGETGDAQKIIRLSKGIFWAVLPSLLFFIVLPLLLKGGMKFGLAMILSCTTMSLAYFLYFFLINKIGI